MTELVVLPEIPQEVGLPLVRAQLSTLTTLEDHATAYLWCEEWVKRNLWAQAEIAASVVRRWGEASLSEFAARVGKSPSRLYDYVRAARAFDISERSEKLSLQHHVICAAAENPLEALRQAEDNDWSTRELEEAVGYQKQGDAVKPRITPRSAVAEIDLLRKIARVAAGLLRGEPYEPSGLESLVNEYEGHFGRLGEE